MFPLLPFVAGLLTGAAATKLIRSQKAKARLDKVQDCLREASVSGLSTIEQSVACLRDRIQATTPAAENADNGADNTAAAPQTAKANAENPARKLSARSKAAKASTAPSRGNK
jgi:Na+-transporting NADH:ubiquinone oxidoreductase subunit NqrC